MRRPIPFRMIVAGYPRRARGPSGITLVELLVAMTVGVVVAGTILYLLIQTNKETDLDLRRERILSVASSSLAGIATWCERARSTPMAEKELYLPDHIRLNARDPETARPGVYELEPARQPESPGMDVKFRFYPADVESPDTEYPFKLIGGDATVWILVTFKYAWEFDGLAPKWDPPQPGSGRPRAAEITVFAQDERARVRSVRLSTVVAF